MLFRSTTNNTNHHNERSITNENHNENQENLRNPINHPYFDEIQRTRIFNSDSSDQSYNYFNPEIGYYNPNGILQNNNRSDNNLNLNLNHQSSNDSRSNNSRRERQRNRDRNRNRSRQKYYCETGMAYPFGEYCYYDSHSNSSIYRSYSSSPAITNLYQLILDNSSYHKINFSSNIFCCFKNFKYLICSIVCPCFLYGIIVQRLKGLKNKENENQTQDPTSTATTTKKPIYNKICSWINSISCGIFYVLSFLLNSIGIYLFITNYYKLNFIEKNKSKNDYGVGGRAKKIYWQELDNKIKFGLIIGVGSFLIFCLMGIYLRCLARKRMKIRQNCFLDWYIAICLPVCSLVQILRDIDGHREIV